MGKENVPNKAIAAGAGSGVGGAIAVLIIALFWPNADASVSAALTTVCSALVSVASTYFTKMEGGG